ncbi:hypothetical protein RQM47_09130 [Rubrivirga sp. S365]|nr:hypothetical protein [Rubrivirga sp. S365]MDT7856801.1 hypothetical protein [Rubrivirga sp. S365]
MRALLLVFAVLVVGCDSSGDDLLPVEGGVLVSLAPLVLYDDLPVPEPIPPSAVIVRTVEEAYCVADELVVETSPTAEGLSIEVLDVRVSDQACPRIRVAADATLDLPDGVGDGFEIAVTGPRLPRDVYVLVLRGGAYRLEKDAAN